MTPLSPTHAVSPLPAQTEGGRVKRREKEVIQWIYSDKKEKLYYIKGGHQLTTHNKQAVKPFDLSSSNKTVLVLLKKNTFTAAAYTCTADVYECLPCIDALAMGFQFLLHRPRFFFSFN